MLTYGLTRLSQAGPLVSLPEIKLALRVTQNQEDSLLERLEQAAYGWVQDRANIAMVPETWQFDQNRFDYPITLPIGPVTAVNELSYVDQDGDTQVMDPADYVLYETRIPALVLPAQGQQWPQTQVSLAAVTTTFSAGPSIPDPMAITAVLMLTAHWYANREAVSAQTLRDVPMAVESIVNKLRMGLYP